MNFSEMTSHDRDLLAAQNIKHFGLLNQNKIGQELPELTTMESAAIAATMK